MYTHFLRSFIDPAGETDLDLFYILRNTQNFISCLRHRGVAFWFLSVKDELSFE